MAIMDCFLEGAMAKARSEGGDLDRGTPGMDSVAETVDREYAAKLRAMAEHGMDQRLRRREDPEDVVQSVLRTVFRRAAEGQLHLGDGGELWRLLETVTRNKILKHAEYHRAKKRTPKVEEYDGVDGIVSSKKPTAEEQAVARDLMDQILEGLDQSYSQIVLLLAEGRSERAVAEQLGSTRQTVRSKIGRLRKRLQKLLDEDAGHDRLGRRKP
jgi:RNA polymerase sigma factor (sigma-70 family)